MKTLTSIYVYTNIYTHTSKFLLRRFIDIFNQTLLFALIDKRTMTLAVGCFGVSHGVK